MAIRKDLDDMLNNLKGSSAPQQPPKKTAPEAAPVQKSHTNKIDTMSVDDLLTTLAHEAEMPKPAPKQEPEPIKVNTPAPALEKPKKKRIVISGELPDYEAIRQRELEKDRKAREEAERKAREEAAEKARLEAERKAREEEAQKIRLETERKAREEEAQKIRLEAERKAREEEAQKARLEAERKAREEAELARIEADRKALEETLNAKPEDAPAFSFEEEINVVSSSVDDDTAQEDTPSVDELMEAAMAALGVEEADEVSEENVPETEEEVTETEEAASDPVVNMIDVIRSDAEQTIADIENSKPVTETEETEEEELPESETEDVEETDEDTEEENEDTAEKRKKRFFSRKKEFDEENIGEEFAEKPKGKLTAALEEIMDEDPDEIVRERSEKTEDDGTVAEEGGKLKKTLYTVLGVVFAVLACVGLITIVAKSVSIFGSFTSGDSKKDGFSDVVYPAVIMDIESFDEPSQLTSDQIITASIWSMIMTDGAMDKYEKTFDVVKVPSVDVESYAVKLFGDGLPQLNHTTVGPAESRFYYNEETKSYNVPVTPVTFTYSPEIKSVTKSGSTYTVVVDYIDELPEWLPKTSSKSVQFTLAETNEGYNIRAMKVLSAANNI